MNKPIKVINLGVGIQSTALYYMSSLNEIERADFAVFADTGGEKTATLNYYKDLKTWSNLSGGIKLYKANYKNLQKDLLNQSNSTNNRFASIPAFTLLNGKKGMLRRQCTNEYKIAQVNKKIREILKIPGKTRFPKMEMWIGITLDEYTRITIPQEKWKINVYPFCGYKVYPTGKCEPFRGFEKTRNDILNWYKLKGFEVPEKSSCKFCPFQADYNWLRLKQTAPKDFKQAVKIDYAIRDSSKKGVTAPLFLHSSLVPLDKVDLSENQKTIWGNCTDYCDI